jgi:hypothetical protein
MEAVDCASCHTRGHFERQTVVIEPPRHLVVSLTRMAFSQEHHRTVRPSMLPLFRPCVYMQPTLERMCAHAWCVHLWGWGYRFQGRAPGEFVCVRVCCRTCGYVQVKDMSNVVLQPLLRIPNVPEEHLSLIATSMPPQSPRSSGTTSPPSRTYGLYAIIVHSGEATVLCPPLP